MHQKNLLARYRKPCLFRALFQLAATLGPLLLLWVLMWHSLAYHYALTLLLAVPTAGLLVRVFIIHHDCGHGSFFRSPRVNHFVGFVLGLLVLTPYRLWRRSHALHHATSGNLDHRGYGDVYTLTVAEYVRQPPLRRLIYRIYRSPACLLGVGPLFYFAIGLRLTFGVPRSWTKERRNIHATNAVLLALLCGVAWLIGVRTLLLLYLPVVALASSLGTWLFFIQHQYDVAYWRRDDDWDFADAALLGSSHYDLPWVLQWFTANIGLHHLHHLDSHIPNYRLQECLDAHPEFRAARRLTLWESLASIRLALWDEQQGKMVRFRDIQARSQRPVADVIREEPRV